MLRPAPDSPTKKRPPLFWWFLANTLAIAFAITAWIVCLTLFRDPTHPTSYLLMMKVGRIDPPAHFTAETAPAPEKINDPRELEARFKPFDPSERETLNRELRRAYLTNFEKAPFLTYVTGEFQIVESRLLGEDDFFSPGLAVKAQALVRPDAVADPLPYPVFIECLLPGSVDDAPTVTPGFSFTLEHDPHCAALLNVGTTWLDEREVILASVVPLAAGDFPTGERSIFEITPPPMANPAGALPALP
jgi:hypothetical protein